MAIAGVIAGVSLFMPYVVVPIRRRLGLATYQWDADPATHPVSRQLLEPSPRVEDWRGCVAERLTRCRAAGSDS